jgi:F0F1-type ATP synthase gamma subunit
MLLMLWAKLSRYQNAAAASREYAERFPEKHHPGPR